MASDRWERRNARARSLGYRNYYDYRAHGYGADAPSTPPARGEKLAALRGHRSKADLDTLARQGRIELVKVLPQDRDPKTKQWRKATIRVTLEDGSEREFVLRGSQLDPGNLEDLHAAMVGGGATVLDSPSLDLFARYKQDYVDINEPDEGYEEAA